MKKKPTGILTMRDTIELIEEVKAMAAKKKSSVSQLMSKWARAGLKDAKNERN